MQAQVVVMTARLRIDESGTAALDHPGTAGIEIQNYNEKARRITPTGLLISRR